MHPQSYLQALLKFCILSGTLLMACITKAETPTHKPSFLEQFSVKPGDITRSTSIARTLSCTATVACLWLLLPGHNEDQESCPHSAQSMRYLCRHHQEAHASSISRSCSLVVNRWLLSSLAFRRDPKHRSGRSLV